MTAYDCPMGQNPHFNFRNKACRENEKKLNDKLTNEIINQKGVKCIYYPADYNTEYDKFFGEDMDRSLLRRFNIKAMFDLPEEHSEYGIFGIMGVDVFVMVVTKSHFHEASQQAWNKGTSKDKYNPQEDAILPQMGDLIEANYGSHTIYEVIDINDASMTFQQNSQIFSFTVREYKDNNLSLLTSTSATMTSAITDSVDVPDILRINDVIDDEKGEVLYDTSATSEDNNPFSGW